jgi:hypothetical protein
VNEAGSIMPWMLAVAGAGVAGGLWLLARGLAGYRLATRIGDTGTSPISSMAAGEVRVSGVIEPAEALLISPLQSRECVYYRSSISAGGELIDVDPDFREERAVGFRVRDPSGDVRVFPRAARWDAPVRFDDKTGSLGEEPPGLWVRTGSAVATGQPDRELQIAQLLWVRPVGSGSVVGLTTAGRSERSRQYEEARLEPGDPVTIVGRALPFSDLSDPTEADVAVVEAISADDPEVAADIAEARAAGLLADDPEDAWGNAAIPGFGIGRPTRAPELDPAAHRLPLAAAAEAERARRTFEIEPERLVLASTGDTPLLIVHGVPGEAVERHQDRFMLGLLGAMLAIGSAMALAVMIGGGFGS